MWKCTISAIYWISNKASIFVFRDMKYHMRWNSGHGSVLKNNEQPFKFTLSNSALETGNAVMGTMEKILLISAR